MLKLGPVVYSELIKITVHQGLDKRVGVLDTYIHNVYNMFSQHIT